MIKAIISEAHLHEKHTLPALILSLFCLPCFRVYKILSELSQEHCEPVKCQLHFTQEERAPVSDLLKIM